MKLKGVKIEGVTYFVSDEDVAKSGSLEAAGLAAKTKRDERLNPPKIEKGKKSEQKPEDKQ